MRWAKKRGDFIRGYEGKYEVCSIYVGYRDYDVYFHLPGLEKNKHFEDLEKAKKWAAQKVYDWFEACGYWPEGSERA